MIQARVITISGLAVTGTTTVAKLLGNRLGWRTVLLGERFRAAARAAGCSPVDLPLSFHHALDRALQDELQASSEVVYDGRFAGWLAREVSGMLRIRLDATPDQRAARAMIREHFSSEAEAKAWVARRDSDDALLFHRLYGAHDYLANGLFHLVVGTQTAEAAVEEIARGIRG